MKAAVVLIVVLGADVARADESRFGVVDLSTEPRHEKIVAAIEKDVARLRPGSKLLDDLAMPKLLATGEGPDDAAERLVKEAELARAAEDCETAVERATSAEAITLASVSLDEERDLLKSIYITKIVCAHKSNRTAERDLAARRLRALAAAPPTGLPTELCEKVRRQCDPAGGNHRVARRQRTRERPAVDQFPRRRCDPGIAAALFIYNSYAIVSGLLLLTAALVILYMRLKTRTNKMERFERLYTREKKKNA